MNSPLSEFANLSYTLEVERDTYTLRVWQGETEVLPLNLTTDNASAMLMYVSGYMSMLKDGGQSFEPKADDVNTMLNIMTLYTVGLTKIVEWITQSAKAATISKAMYKQRKAKKVKNATTV